MGDLPGSPSVAPYPPFFSLLLLLLLLLRSCMNDPYLRSLDIRRALLGWAAPQPWTSPGAEVCPVCVLDAEHRLKAMGELYAAPPMATELTPFFLLLLLLPLVQALPNQGRGRGGRGENIVSDRGPWRGRAPSPWLGGLP